MRVVSATTCVLLALALEHSVVAHGAPPARAFEAASIRPLADSPGFVPLRITPNGRRQGRGQL
jgi:hypothetical protein